jgi:hypothetical protein
MSNELGERGVTHTYSGKYPENHVRIPPGLGRLEDHQDADVLTTGIESQKTLYPSPAMTSYIGKVPTVDYFFEDGVLAMFKIK